MVLKQISKPILIHR